MDENGKTPQKDYSVEEILAEARIIKNREPPPAQDTARNEPKNREEILRQARRALNMEAGSDGPAGGGKPENSESETKPEKKKKKHRFSLFGRKKKREEWREEDDLYYGLQLRSLEEYRKEYEKTILAEGKSPDEDNTGTSFPYLFDGSGENDAPDMTETFERIHRERHERLEKIMRQAGLDPDEILPQESPVQQPEVPTPGPSEPEIPQPEPPHGPAVTPGPQRDPQPKHPVTRPVPEPPDTPEVTSDAEENDAEDSVEPSDSKENEPAKAEENPPPVKEPVKVPPKAKKEQRTPPPRTEPTDGTKPGYRCGSAPIHMIEPKSLQEILESEAAAYPLPEPPEPIPFPQKETVPPEEPDDVPSDDEEEQNPQSEPLPQSPDILVNASDSDEQIPISAAESEQEIPAHGNPRKFRLFGSEEPIDPYDQPPEEQEELDDYTDPADAPSIRHDLLKNLTRLSLRLAVTGISTLIMLAVGILAEYPAVLPSELHTFLMSPSYPVIQLVFLLIAAGFNFPSLWNGIKGMTSFQANTDSAVSVAVLATLIQNAVLLVLGIPQGIYLYAPLAAMAMLLNTAGKFSMMRRIYLNFRGLCTKDRKYAVHLYNDYNTALRLAQNCVLGEPRIAYQSEAKFLRNFLKISYAPDPSDHLSQILAPAGLLLSLALCAASAFLTPAGGFSAAVTIFAVSCCICVPFTNMLCVNLPVSRLCSIARRSGSLLTGWAAIDRFSETNAVMLDAQDLFPRGTVILNGIRTFAGQRIDEAILDAAALMCTVGGPLADVFDQIIKSRRDILPEISQTVYEDGRGVVGIVSGRQILIGSRELMQAHGIQPPSRDYEKKYIQSGKRLVYLASEGSLVAMFIINYRSDLHRSQVLRRMERNGIGLIVRTSDPNITPRFLAECFGLYEQEITVLPEHLGKIYTDLVSAEPDRTDAMLATKGRPFAMIRLLTGCIRQRANITAAVALQAAAVGLGFALVAFLSLYSGLEQLSLTALSIYELFWAVAVLLVPRIRRP
jgi:hypothetical protein